MDSAAGLATSLRRGALEFCVLALMEKQQRYGVELVRRLKDEMVLSTSEGTIYPLLSRLRRAGWVETAWEESPVGPPRRYYALTGDGRVVLDRFRADWVAFRDSVDRLVEVGSGEGRR